MTVPEPPSGSVTTAVNLPGALQWLQAHSEHSLTSRELAELLWLASRLPAQPSPTPRRPPDASKPGKFQPDTDSSKAISAERANEDKGAQPQPDLIDPFAPTVFPDRPAAEGAAAPEPLLPLAVLPDPALVAELQATLPVRLAQAPPLGDRGELLRALRPLLRRRPDPIRSCLDEERTAETWAQTQLLLPVFQPAQEPWFDQVLVLVDSGLTMEVWQGLAGELVTVLASSQVFPHVRLQRLAIDRLPSPPVALRAGVLVLLLTDAIGPHWWDGRMFDALDRWCCTCPVAILQLLPPWQWGRTALSVAQRVAVSNGETAVANSRYAVQLLDWWDDEPLSRAAVLPVIPLDHASLAPWSAVVMGEAGYTSSGVILPEPDGRVQRLADRQREEPPDTPEERWASFCASATPQAQRLLMVMATAPVLTLPVIGLLKEAKVHGATGSPLPIAEVLMSGLVRRLPEQEMVTDPNQLQFNLVPEVVDLLLERLSDADRLDVIRTVSALVERRWDSQIGEPSFAAVLLDPAVTHPDEGLSRGVGAFAALTARLLETLPGAEARAFAERIRQGTGLAPRPLWPAAMVFDEEPFEAAQLVDTPELEPIRTVAAQVVAQELEPIPFTTARLGADLTILRSAGSTWGFHEPFGHGALTLIQIPAGSFLMGSPEDEPERHSDEGPQHEVAIQEFFMAQTPITQAQWREVAGWQEREAERWGRELNPTPSQFCDQADSHHRPVEQVSWHDAIEFCNRLSQRTGRHYTLPSEAQWEYACRAGTTTPFAFGSTLSAELANYDAHFTYADGPKGESRKQTTPVGMFPANAWGLHDMHGNVWEWCLDHLYVSYEGVPADGSPWLSTTEPTKKATKETASDRETEEEGRLLRGGSWTYDPWFCRSASRNHGQPDGAYDSVGFRVVCLPQHPSSTEPLEGIPAGDQEGSRPAPVIGRLRPLIRTA
jgi:formylglycine-generating enzyme required for sulfatase activity